MGKHGILWKNMSFKWIGQQFFLSKTLKNELFYIYYHRNMIYTQAKSLTSLKTVK